MERDREREKEKLHDVSFVDGSDLLASIVSSIVKSEFGNAARLLACRDFQRLDHTRHTLVLESRILAFGLLAYHDKVNVVVPQLQARHAFDAHDMREQVEFESDLLIHRLELTALADRRRRDHTFEAHSVAHKALHQIIH